MNVNMENEDVESYKGGSQLYYMLPGLIFNLVPSLREGTE